uniref:N-acetylmuramoyl-L-alanine amidase-like domain-containing protein n=1 Tax=uncultured Draconibacterium sp. TaxID=1573823 RepID=UPI0032168FB7
MKKMHTIFLVLMLLASYAVNSQIIYEQKDKEILNEVFHQFRNSTDKSTAELVVLVGDFFKETPYVAHTLETEPEQLVLNLREMDCTTYAENCLSIARTLKNGNLTFEEFAKELTAIRYRNGIISGYSSRLHYFSDWIYENDKQGLIKRLSEEIANTPYPLEINFMSSHPDSYKQLKLHNNLIPVLAEKEEEISGRQMFYIPKNSVSKFESKIKDGDIVGITTSVEGLDITHVGIIINKNGRVHLMHASSVAEKVILSENTLEDYLAERKSATGIMIVRPI